MRLYISGPIMGVPDHRERFAELEKTIRLLGHIPINPIDVPSECGGTCRNSGRVMLPSGHSWECYLRYDIIAMLKCDGVMFMRGWEGSQGARFEHFVASTTGLALRYEINVESLSKGR